MASRSFYSIIVIEKSRSFISIDWIRLMSEGEKRSFKQENPSFSTLLLWSRNWIENWIYQSVKKSFFVFDVWPRVGFYTIIPCLWRIQLYLSTVDMTLSKDMMGVVEYKWRNCDFIRFHDASTTISWIDRK